MTHDDHIGIRPVRAFLTACLVVFALLAGGLGTLWYTQGRMVVEKVLTQLAMPLGLVWLGLTLLVVVLATQRNWLTLMLSLLIWLVLTLSSVQIFIDPLIASLEEPFFLSTPLEDDPYDVLVVLGGGTSIGKNGVVELNDSGDRVVMAARMYHRGLAERIVCTGSKIKGLHHDNAPGAGEQSQQILMDLQVPEKSIEVLSGRNTFEEFENLRESLGDDKQHIGLITSAWHLPRAIRLAKSAGLNVEPVPSDFRTHNRPTSVLFFIPSDGPLRNSSRAVKEYLARLMGR